jgi:pimeloyl-ACP methyl ester carboxylesterase
MPRLDFAVLCLTAILLVPFTLLSQTTPTPPREHFQNAEVIYGWAQDNAGHKLRTFITRPKNASGKVPAVFFVGWLSCDSVEYARGETDGFGAIFWRLIEQSGYATVRMDKAGVGESQGDCSKLDFKTELSGYQSVFDEMLKYDFIDPAKIFVVGLSNGGGTSALIPRQHPVRGYIAASSWGRTWYEHMLELERGRLTAGGASPADVNSGVKAFTELYTLYLIRGMTPGEAVAQRPEWKGLWYDAPDGQYGRPAAFYQQLQALNLGEAWQKVTVPVLVMHGTADTIMSDADARAIAENVNRAHPGMARYVEVAGGDHLLSVKGKLADEVAPVMMKWMQEQLAAAEISSLFRFARRQPITSIHPAGEGISPGPHGNSAAL